MLHAQKQHIYGALKTHSALHSTQPGGGGARTAHRSTVHYLCHCCWWADELDELMSWWADELMSWWADELMSWWADGGFRASRTMLRARAEGSITLYSSHLYSTHLLLLYILLQLYFEIETTATLPYRGPRSNGGNHRHNMSYLHSIPLFFLFESCF
jgi:hypothetical protein